MEFGGFAVIRIEGGIDHIWNLGDLQSYVFEGFIDRI